jgi:hypothetical protein
MTLEGVPKRIGKIRNEWSPHCSLIFSFRLEMYRSLLLSKARESFIKYKYNIVIVNTLQDSRAELFIVDQADSKLISTLKHSDNDDNNRDINDGNDDEIEKHLIQEMIKLHNCYIY